MSYSSLFSRTVFFFSILPEDIDECQTGRCHQDAVCYNTEGSFTCQCKAGYYGDGFSCSPGEPFGIPSLSTSKPTILLKQCIIVSRLDFIFIPVTFSLCCYKFILGICHARLDSLGNGFLWYSCRLHDRKMKNGSFSFSPLFIPPIWTWIWV